MKEERMITEKEAEATRERLTELRRYFHRHPDVTGHEEPTVEAISRILTKDGIAHEVVEEGGIIAYIYGKGFEPAPGEEPWTEGYVENGTPSLLKEGCGTKDRTLTWKMKTVLLRADIDALPVRESEENLSARKVCVSEKEGVSHACGHDSHIAMILAAAEYLAAHREEITGRVIVIFERGEEGPNNLVFILRRMLEKNLHIDTAYAAHTYFGLESGKIAVQAGPVMAGGLFYKVRLTGKGGHGSRPDYARNPIDCYTEINNALSSFRMKMIDPFHTFTAAQTFVHSGDVDNVIPEELMFGGNARFYDLSDGRKYRDYFYETLERICPMYGCTYEVVYCMGPKVPLINDAECVKTAKKAAELSFGAENVVETEPWMACETFCFPLAIWPGVFCLIGDRNPEKGTGANHHSPIFDVDEDILPAGCAMAVNYALCFLREEGKPGHGWFDGAGAEIYEASGYKPEFAALLRYGTPFHVTEGSR